MYETTSTKDLLRWVRWARKLHREWWDQQHRDGTYDPPSAAALDVQLRGSSTVATHVFDRLRERDYDLYANPETNLEAAITAITGQPAPDDAYVELLRSNIIVTPPGAHTELVEVTPHSSPSQQYVPVTHLSSQSYHEGVAVVRERQAREREVRRLREQDQREQAEAAEVARLTVAPTGKRKIRV